MFALVSSVLCALEEQAENIRQCHCTCSENATCLPEKRQQQEVFLQNLATNIDYCRTLFEKFDSQCINAHELQRELAIVLDQLTTQRKLLSLYCTNARVLYILALGEIESESFSSQIYITNKLNSHTTS